MKTFLLAFSISLLAIGSILSQEKTYHSLRGTLTDSRQNRLGYVTVMMKSVNDVTPVSGTVTDSTGRFEISVPEDEYTVHFTLLGYEPQIISVRIDGPCDIGTVRMDDSNLEIDMVTIKGDRFRWEADRVVWNVEGSQFSIGKSALEILPQAPGVWVEPFSEQISIYGKTGTRVMVNDRIVKGNSQQVANYLNNLKAEDIQLIEVIPISGADQDANMIGGLIKITTRRQRDNGLYGSIEFRYSGAIDEKVNSMRPSGNLNFKRNKLSLYAFLNYSRSRSLELSDEQIVYLNQDRGINSDIKFTRKSGSGAVRVGGIYDFDPANSIGFEISYTPSKGRNTTLNLSEESISGDLTSVGSHYYGEQKNRTFSASGNFIRRLKKQGSTFKILADYSWHRNDNPQDYFSEYRGAVSRDTTYRSHIDRINRIYSMSSDLDIKLSDASQFRTGIKYTYNHMENSTFFEALTAPGWTALDPLNNENTFSENIAALYADYSIRFSNMISLKVGLRGEYTHASPKSNRIEIDHNQSYFDLFPVVNLMMPLKKDFTHLLIAGYARKIRRPSFNDLNPFRVPASEFSYIVGNPYLSPTYSNDFSLNWVISQKYSVMVGIMDRKDDYGRVAVEDEEQPGIMLLRQENISNNTNYFFNASLPISLTDWWTLNTNVYGSHNRLEVLEEKHSINVLRANISNMVTFLQNYGFNLDFMYLTPTYNGNLRNDSFYQMNLSVNGKFAKNRVTASVFVHDVLNSSRISFRVNEPTFHRKVHADWSFRQFGASLRYNFKSGKEFKAKNVESGVSEEKERLKTE